MLTIDQIKRLCELTPGFFVDKCDRLYVPDGTFYGFPGQVVGKNTRWINNDYPLLLSQACDEVGINVTDTISENLYSYEFFHATKGLITDCLFNSYNEAREAGLISWLKENK